MTSYEEHMREATKAVTEEDNEKDADDLTEHFINQMFRTQNEKIKRKKVEQELVMLSRKKRGIKDQHFPPVIESLLIMRAMISTEWRCSGRPADFRKHLAENGFKHILVQKRRFGMTHEIL